MMFQSYALFPHMNVIDNVSYGPRMSGLRREEARARARDALHGVGLVDFDERLPGELSGGQQQRVALARALVLEPSVMLFDEPLSNLDVRLRREMREEIRSLQQRLRLTVAYVTHDQSEALAVSDQIIVMDHGVIAQQGSPQQLYAQPESEFVAGFMGEAMVFSAFAHTDGRVDLGPLSLAQRPGIASGIVKVAVRPEAWLIGSAVGLAATVRKVAYLGSYYEYAFETELGSVLVISTDLSSPLSIGAQTILSLARHGVSVVPAGGTQSKPTAFV
jgi:iron(III) transport system ATP-binding protein